MTNNNTIKLSWELSPNIDSSNWDYKVYYQQQYQVDNQWTKLSDEEELTTTNEKAGIRLLKLIEPDDNTGIIKAIIQGINDNFRYQFTVKAFEGDTERASSTSNQIIGIGPKVMDRSIYIKKYNNQVLFFQWTPSTEINVKYELYYQKSLNSTIIPYHTYKEIIDNLYKGIIDNLNKEIIDNLNNQEENKTIYRLSFSQSSTKWEYNFNVTASMMESNEVSLAENSYYCLYIIAIDLFNNKTMYNPKVIMLNNQAILENDQISAKIQIS